jgi:hypothetical protein
MQKKTNGIGYVFQLKGPAAEQLREAIRRQEQLEQAAWAPLWTVENEHAKRSTGNRHQRRAAEARARGGNVVRTLHDPSKPPAGEP